MLTKAEQKQIRGLHQKKMRDREGVYLIEGLKSLEEALVANAPLVRVLIKGDLARELRGENVMSEAQRKGVSVDVISDKELDAISSLTTPPGVIAISQIVHHNFIVPKKSVMCIDDVKDPGNMGTLLRTADWFGVTDIVTSSNSVDVHNPKVVQATMGSLFRLRIAQDQDIVACLQQLRAHNFSIVVTTLNQGSGSLEGVSSPYALVVGNESQGVSQGVIDSATHRYTISGAGRTESLNVAVAAGIVLHELF